MPLRQPCDHQPVQMPPELRVLSRSLRSLFVPGRVGLRPWVRLSISTGFPPSLEWPAARGLAVPATLIRNRRGDKVTITVLPSST